MIASISGTNFEKDYIFVGGINELIRLTCLGLEPCTHAWLWSSPKAEMPPGHNA
ncbi:hypothetical protein [Paraburkholderia caledonica]|uniref:hypothetical protein n=1 Tax=Paraburkholderia caledonica TaxID=134536 RepID=UPI001374CFAF|nr:hypothetical protein [Paraburkholderia caledonica]